MNLDEMWLLYDMEIIEQYPEFRKDQMEKVNLGDMRNLEKYPKLHKKFENFRNQMRDLLWKKKAIEYFNTNPVFRKKILKQTRKSKFEIVQALNLSYQVLKTTLEKEIKKYIKEIEDNESTYVTIDLLEDCIKKLKKLWEKNSKLKIDVSQYEEQLSNLKNKFNLH